MARWQSPDDEKPAGSKGRWASESSADAGFKRPSDLDAFLSGAGDGLSFGFGDELQGLIHGAGAALSGKDFWSGYDKSVDDAREWQYRSQLSNPYAYGGGQIASAVVPGFAAGGALRAGLGATKFANIGKRFGLMSRVAGAGLAGGAGGALYGAGSADGKDVLESAKEGAIWGAPAGMFGQVAFGELLPAIGKSFANTVSPQKRVVEEISGMGARMGDTPADFGARLAAAPDEAVMGDVVLGGPELLRDAALRPSKGRNDLDKVLTGRNNEVAQKTADDLWDTLGTGIPRDAAKRVKSLSDVQETQARPLYAEVYQTRVQAVPKAARDFIAFNSRSGARFSGAIDEARESMRRSLGVDVTDDVLMQYPQFWHTVLHNVEDRVGRVISGAKMDPLGAPMGKSVAEMTGDARKFNDTVRDMLGDKFKAAQDIYAGAAKSKAAEEFGVEMVKEGGDLNLGKVAERLAKMTPAERQHAQYGALSAMEEMLRKADTGTGMANVLRPLVGNQSKRRTLQHIFGQSQGFDDLMSRIDKRVELFNNTVKAGIGRGPQTAEKLTGARALGERLPSTGSAVSDLIRFVTSKGNDRYSEEVSNEIIRIMGMPVRQAEAEILAAGGMEKWLKGKHALAQAQRRMQNLPEERTKLLTNALTNNIYAPVFGAGVASSQGLE